MGTTLAWWVDKTTPVPAGAIDVSASGITIADGTCFAALRSLLRQHDGAAYCSPDGQVLSIGTHLQYTKSAEQFIPQVGGTRHTSAQRHSFDEPRVVVFVVSEDGPVSVFSDGVKVTELLQITGDERARDLRRLVPAKAEDVHSAIRLEKCGKCGKMITVDVVIIYGLKERETGECPICGTTVYSSMCWQINTRIVKVLPHETDLDHALEQWMRSPT